MGAEFLIKVQKWLGKTRDLDIEDVTYADLKMTIRNGQHILTRAHHENDDQPRNSINVPVHRLACWFAYNWWRLRWEPELPNSVAEDDLPSIIWQMSHNISGVSGGYQWPNVSFASDGNIIQVHSQQSKPGYSDTSVRFLNSFDTHISVDAFENAVDDFIDIVINRLEPVLKRNCGEAFEDAVDLKGLWEEVREERADPSMTLWRKTEAILGYNPDEAPTDQVQEFMTMMNTHGQAAIEEMMAVQVGKHPDELKEFLEESRTRSLSMKVPEVIKIRERMEQGVGDNHAVYGAANPVLPWVKGYELAALVRDSWGLEQGPINSSDLLDRIGVSTKHSKALWKSRKNAVASSGFRSDPDSGKLAACIYRPSREGKRFALVRMIGDYLIQQGQEELLLPITDAHTSRQKVQRAFAQEFLCPYESLRGHFESENDITVDNVKKVARKFEVSPVLIIRKLSDDSSYDQKLLENTRLQLAA